MSTPADSSSAPLFDPLPIRDVTLPNRIAVSPMCQYSSTDGMANDWHLVHLGSRAVGGAGLVMVEATAVEERGRISPGDMGLWKDEQIEPLARIAQFLAQNGAVPAIQLAHAGRKASTDAPWRRGQWLSPENGGWSTVAPSAIPFAAASATPVELTVEEIRQIVKAFATAAQRALQAGFQVVELHGAHGYLAHEFLSPLTNQRTDAYGGSVQNRQRFLLEVIEAVRAVWPQHLPLFLRISATDWVEGGWTTEDSVALARIVEPLGVDLIDCSAGGAVEYAQIPTAPGYQVPFAQRIRQEAGILTGAVGLITDPVMANQIVQDGSADIVLLARELLRNPYWPLEAAKVLQTHTAVPPQYERAFPKQMAAR